MQQRWRTPLQSNLECAPENSWREHRTAWSRVCLQETLLLEGRDWPGWSLKVCAALSCLIEHKNTRSLLEDSLLNHPIIPTYKLTNLFLDGIQWIALTHYCKACSTYPPLCSHAIFAHIFIITVLKWKPIVERSTLLFYYQSHNSIHYKPFLHEYTWIRLPWTPRLQEMIVPGVGKVASALPWTESAVNYSECSVRTSIYYFTPEPIEFPCQRVCEPLIVHLQKECVATERYIDLGSTVAPLPCSGGGCL